MRPPLVESRGPGAPLKSSGGGGGGGYHKVSSRGVANGRLGLGLGFRLFGFRVFRGLGFRGQREFGSGFFFIKAMRPLSVARSGLRV